jgi:putative ABC transport system permease protein
MWKNFFLTSIRNLKRNISFSLLNIGGLVLGISACIVILLFVNYETHFDHIHSKGNRIYRLNEIQRFDGTPEQTVSLSMYPMATALKKDYPEIEQVVRIDPHENLTLRWKQKEIMVKQILVSDSTFFQVFDFHIMDGEKTTALSQPNGIVLTASTARKLLGKTNVVGQVIEVYQDDHFKPFVITAIAEDVPENSHIQFDGIVPLQSQDMQDWMNTWDANWVNTYIALKENADIKSLQSVMPSFLQKYMQKEGAKHYELLWQPLYDIHLRSENITHDSLNYKKFSYSYIRIFLVVAIFVLLIAIFNFINLSTARAAKRAKEVGIRKTIGANQWQLIKQFTGEAVFFAFIAMVLALAVIQLSLPYINSIINRDIHFNIFHSLKLWIGLISLSIIVGFLSGVYPAIFISSYQPIKVLKGVINTSSKKGFSLRNFLVVTQFAIAVILIVSTLIIIQQLNFIKNKDIGFDKDQVITLPMNKTANEKFEVLKAEFLKDPNIIGMTGYNQRLGNNINQMGADYITDKGEKKHLSVSHLVVDYDYLSFYKIKLIAGRDFSKNRGDDNGRSYIINETLAKELETKNPVGTSYAASWIKDMGQVIGVTNDFNFNSLHSKIAPLYISILGWDYNEIAVKLKPGTIKSSLVHIKRTWESMVPDMPFSYSFLDEHLNNLYDTDQRAKKIVSILTFLAIAIAGLGLFGVALFNIETRTKEIGIRKTLGANVLVITQQLVKEFLKPVIIALIIAFPLSWIVMDKWLENFAYRINISWWTFAIAGISVVLVSLITVSWQTIRAARVNPVKSLRTE